MIEKYKESEYQKEYIEILDVYNSQIKPLKKPWLIAFIAVCTVIGTVIFAYIIYFLYVNRSLFRYNRRWIRKICAVISFSAFVLSFIPLTYFIRLRQVIEHKNRRLKNLDEKKMQAVSAGIYDANS